MNGGTLSIDSPRLYSAVADGLLKTLGIDPVALTKKCADRNFYPSLGLGTGLFFDQETFGADKLVVVTGGISWNELLAPTPLSPTARSDIARIEEKKRILPDMDGLEVCRKIRAGAQTPILMLTARGDAMDRVVGLEIGADDYLPKPFEPRELLARLRAILRRSKGGEQASEVLRFGRLEIDAGAREVRLDGEPRSMTGYQFDLLLALARHAGRVMSREAIMDLMKNERLDAFDRSIDVHISRIRAAIEDDPKKPRRVITVRGAGYVFAKAQD